jgi:propanol-preferring alcohol dehydrogenase
MSAWIVDEPRPIDDAPLAMVRRPVPVPGEREVLVRIATCGVCRTDLHVAAGDLPIHRQGVVPGHEIVGYVEINGPEATRFQVGERIGIAWLRATCGICRFCSSSRENLCVQPRFTGWDDDGGYAEFAVVDEAYAYRLPDVYDDVSVAPLLCAGIIGFRALEHADVPRGGRLGIYGFGGSAHIAAQIAMHRGATVHVLTRSASARALALQLGCASAGAADDPPPEPLDSAILFAPAGELVPVALRALDRGGTLAIAGIHLSDVPAIDYQRELFHERQVRSVTANTRSDGERFLAEAVHAGVRIHTVPYRFDAADAALAALWHDAVDGAAVLVHDWAVHGNARSGATR